MKFAVAFSLLLLNVAFGDMRADLSLIPPHRHLDSTGHRTLEHFTVGGDAIVHREYVRLTPDRQSKRGWVWANAPLNLEKWSLVFEFRISGKGQQLFGDGIGLWLTDHAVRKEGPIHGFTENFLGFGIIVDTFHNTDLSNPHKDVSVIWNDGTLNEDQVRNTQTGCDVAGLRYHETRADFSVFNSSRLRISWANHQLTVEVDARGDGNWAACTNVLDHRVPVQAMTATRLGVLATTGQLADNHDLVNLRVFDTVSEAALMCQLPSEKPEGFHRDLLDLEHRMTGLVEAISNTVTKLKKQESEAEVRIQQLEARMKALVDGHVTDRLQKLEELVDEKVAKKVVQRVDHLEALVGEVIDARLRNIEAVMETAVHKEIGKSGAGQWKVPFLVLMCFLLIFAAWSFKNFRWVKSMHTL